MKRLIFGCTLMLCGAICGTGWFVAHCSACVEPGAWSTILNIVGSMDGWIVMLFYTISIIGAVLAVKTQNEDK